MRWLDIIKHMTMGITRCRRKGPIILTLALLLSACMPLPAALLPPAPIPTRLQPTFTALPTLTPLATNTPPALTPTPIPLESYAGPAGCLAAQAQAGRSTAQMLAYANELLGWQTPLERRQLLHVWNAVNGAYASTGEDVLVFATGDIVSRYLVQNALDALHVAGFVTWLRMDARQGEHILALPLHAGVQDGPWSGYVQAYFAASDSLPEGDATVRPARKLTPCRWMVSAGFAPSQPAGVLEAADWSQPDFKTAAAAYVAETDEAAAAVARQIAWLDGRSEAPALMCGPLAWAITDAAGAFPPGYGAWHRSPKSFWLPKPSENGRPWSLFAPGTFTVQRFNGPLGTFDLSVYPLETGDLLYTYAGSDGFDHLLVVSEADADGNRFAVTNLVQVEPEEQVTIQRVLLYNQYDPSVGILRNQWANDHVNGRTGDKAFEIFRWAWRDKDIRGEAVDYTVLPGDTLPLVAARWRTPPDAIAAANHLHPADPLSVGQVLVIPPN